MSAEGKKKRGISGMAKAQTAPFRLGGRPCDYSLHRGRTDRVNAKWRHTVDFALTIIHKRFDANVTERLRLLYDR